MATITVAVLTTDDKKTVVETIFSALTPDYTITMIRGCCSTEGNPTYQTTPTHWYGNGSAADSDDIQLWQDAVAGNFPGGFEVPEGLGLTLPQVIALIATDDVKIYTAQNASDAVAWAATNLGSEGLQFVPDAPL